MPCRHLGIIGVMVCFGESEVFFYGAEIEGIWDKSDRGNDRVCG